MHHRHGLRALLCRHRGRIPASDLGGTASRDVDDGQSNIDAILPADAVEPIDALDADDTPDVSSPPDAVAPIDAGPFDPCDDCHDGLKCTVDQCDGVECVHIPLDCDDSNFCTDDVCTEDGCLNTLKMSLPCHDGNPCTHNDQCSLAGCAGVKCADDGNPCTSDSCAVDFCVHIWQAGCTSAPVTDEDLACQLEPTCQNGEGRCAHGIEWGEWGGYEDCVRRICGFSSDCPPSAPGLMRVCAGGFCRYPTGTAVAQVAVDWSSISEPNQDPESASTAHTLIHVWDHPALGSGQSLVSTPGSCDSG
ncbi:MAG: hypothetical protein ACI9OJ_005757, partial [Myxococcota bacterium]